MKRATIGLSLCLALGLATPGLAQDLRIAGTSVGVSVAGAAFSTLKVTGPGGFEMQAFSRTGSASVQLAAGGRLQDGTYTYEFTAATGEMVPNTNKLDNGRGQEPAMIHASMTQTGTFTVAGGKLIETPAAASEDKDG